jgi:hypothetical protein
MRCPLSTPQSHRVSEVPSESTATALRPPPSPLDAPNMHPPTCRAARSRADRSDPTLAARAQAPLARRGHAQCIKLGERGERARHTPRQRVVVEVAAHPERTRPLGGPTPHPLQRCAPTVPAHRTPSGGVPLEYSVVTSRARVPSESTPTALLPHRPYSMPQTCTPRHAARSDQNRPIRPCSAARANAAGKKGARTVIKDW